MNDSTPITFERSIIILFVQLFLLIPGIFIVLFLIIALIAGVISHDPWSQLLFAFFIGTMIGLIFVLPGLLALKSIIKMGTAGIRLTENTLEWTTWSSHPIKWTEINDITFTPKILKMDASINISTVNGKKYSIYLGNLKPKYDRESVYDTVRTQWFNHTKHVITK